MKRTKNQIAPLILATLLLSGCEVVGVAKFDELAKNKKTGAEDPSENFTFSGISSISHVTETTVQINWPNHSEATVYILYNVSSGSPVIITTISAPATSYTIEGLATNTTYSYRVRALNSNGISDSNTNNVSVTTDAPAVVNPTPNIPSSLALQSPATSPSSVKTPSITVSGVADGDTVKLFTNPTCTAEIGSEVATGATVNITTTALPAASYTIYARTIGPNGTSACSAANLAYERSACPDGYILVAANPDVGTTSNFCVMKYEAKTVEGVATSQATGNLWVNINGDDALLACQAIGPGYDLISNAEWMTIARNIEAENSNWDGGVLSRGWSAATASDGFQNTAAAPSSDANCLYNTAANTCGANGSHKLKRTHTLSNGEEIWDFAGNVYEWVDWEVETPNTASFTPGPVGCSTAWHEVQAKITSCAGQTPNLGDPLPSTSALASPLDTNLTSTSNIGKLYGGTGGGTIRGASWNTGVNAGVFAIFLNVSPAFMQTYLGFRCVFRE